MIQLIHHLTNPSRPEKRLILGVTDATLIVAACALALALWRGAGPLAAPAAVWQGLLAVVPVTLLTFHALGLYRIVLRFITGQALIAVTLGAGAGALALFAAARLLGAPVPLWVAGLHGLLSVVATAGLRFALRGLLRWPDRARRLPVIIYGAGEAGRQAAAALDQGGAYRPAAFVDDDPARQGTVLAGHRVVPPAQIETLVDRLRPAVVLLAMPGISRARRHRIIQRFEPFGIAVRPVPGIGDVAAGRAGADDRPGVTPEDLLGREPVPPRPDLMGCNIAGKVVLVSGAGGSIGAELCRQIIRQAPAALLLLEVSEFALYRIHMELRQTLAQTGAVTRLEPLLGSVQNPGRMRAMMRLYRVQTVYHAAAYKHVDMVERNVVEGVRNNVFGTRVMAEAAVETGVANFILISTDKAVRPTGIMGASKRMAELICQGLARKRSRTTFSMVRFGNVLCSSGSVIPLFQAQIDRGGPVTVRHREVTRFFMTIPEAAQLVIQAGAMARGGDVFVLDMGEPVKILDLACTMVRLHGLTPYVLDDADRPDPGRGDIPVQIVGLARGEKLHEELLIGDQPQGTGHPRIMTATEAAPDPGVLHDHLDRLMRACRASDIAAIRLVLRDAPLAFQPADEADADPVLPAPVRCDAGTARAVARPDAPRALAVVRGAE